MTAGMDDELKGLLAALGDAPQASTIYGELVREEAVTVIPVGCIEIHSKGAVHPHPQRRGCRPPLRPRHHHCVLPRHRRLGLGQPPETR